MPWGLAEHHIGREADSGIFIEDEHISRQHAKLIISADAIEIEDLDSTSGTFLEGMAVRGRIPVMPGQKVHISDLYLDIERAGFGELIKGARLGGGRFTLVEKLGQGGKLGPLHGLPLAHKDLVTTKGIRTTFGSPIFQNFVPEENAYS